MSVTVRTPEVGRGSGAQRLFAAVGVLLATGVVGVLVGPLGAFVAVGVGVGGYLFGWAVAFAVGQVVLVGLLPLDVPLEYFALAEAGLCFVLLAGLARRTDLLASLLATLVVSALIGGGTWLTFRTTGSLWVTGGLLVGGIALAVYTGHRYERVRLGLVGRE